MPRLNGKFVSQAAYDAAQAERPYPPAEDDHNSTEETPMSEYSAEEAEFETADVDTKPDSRRGVRPTTVYKQAANKKTAAEVKLLRAEKKLRGFDNGRDELLQAVADAKEAVAAADVELSEAADAL